MGKSDKSANSVSPASAKGPGTPERRTRLQGPRGSRRPAALCCALLLLPATTAWAAQEAHEHGKGELNVVVDGSTVGLELRVPGMDVVGFEHQARTQKEKAAVLAALERFSDPRGLFELTPAAGCEAIKAETSLGGEQGAQGHPEKDDHDHDEKHGHDEKDKKNEHAGKHKDEREHEAEHDHEKAHSELHAEYYFECATPTRLKRLIVNAFDHLSARSLRVAVVTTNRQAAVVLTPAERSLDLEP